MIKKIFLLFVLSFVLISCWSNAENTSLEKQEQTQVEKHILALWDSVTAGYNLELSDAYPAQLQDLLKADGYNYKITNAWVSGDTSKNLLDRIELYDELDVDIYLLTIWGNDGLRRQSVDTMKENISTIIEHLQNVNPQAQVVLSWMQMPINLWWNYSKEFNKSYEELANKYDLPLYEFFLEGVAKDSSLNLSDGIHPNKKWYSVIANNLYVFLEDEKIISQ
jgi:acyl-CoA thioesterase-1